MGRSRRTGRAREMVSPARARFLDEHVRASLEELAKDCERRGQAASASPVPQMPHEILEPRLDQS